MAYQYRFVDVLARGLENAANRAERAEAARVQQEQFGAQMDIRERELTQKETEFSSLEKIREREAELAQEKFEFEKLKEEAQAWRDEADFQLNLERLDIQKQGLEVQKEAARARGEVAAERPTIGAKFLPSELREKLQITEDEQIDLALLPTYNTMVNQMGIGEGATNMYEFMSEDDLLVSGTGWKRIIEDKNTKAGDKLIAEQQLNMIQSILGKDRVIPAPERKPTRGL